MYYNETMYKINFFLALAILINIYANDDYENFECYSTDPELGDSAFWAITAIELYDKKKYQDAVNVVDACFQLWAPEAGNLQKKKYENNVKQPSLGKVDWREKKKIQENYLLNDVSMALWAKAVSLEMLEKNEILKKAYSQCIYMSHGRAWDPNGWFWSPSNDCAKRAKKLLNKK